MNIQPGRYQHYKGPYYQVIDTVRHSETLEWLVLYRPLYIKTGESEAGLWVRPFTMFTELVTVNGEQRPRFTRVSD